jgi:hypothetical protein
LLFAVIGGGNTGSLVECIDPHIVKRGLDPRIHADVRAMGNPVNLRSGESAWIAGSSPAMTIEIAFR